MGDSLLHEFTRKIDKLTSRDEVVQLVDSMIQKTLTDTYLVCLLVDHETFEFVPARPVDRALLANVESYIDQGMCAEAFTSGRPVYLFNTNKYDFKNDEALILFPLLFGGHDYGVIMVVTKQDECKRVLNEMRDEVEAVFLLLTKFIELFDGYETEKKQRGKLASVEQHLNNLLESVAHGIMVIDNNNVINIFNRNAEIMFGMSAKEVKGQVYREVFSEKLTKAFDILIQNTHIEGTILDHEVKVQLNEQVEIPIGITTSVLRDQGGSARGVVCMCRDLTLTKEVNRLKEIDKMKSEFVSMVSHELKTPIAVIKSSIEILLAARKLGKTLSADFEKDTFETVNGEIDRLAQIINDLLSLSRIEAGKVEINREPIDMNELLKKTLHIFKVQNATHPITVTNKLIGKVMIDQEKIKQVVVNYISNAIKYSPNGCDIEVIVEKQDNNVIVSVRDHGLGISEKQIEKVFEKFHRVQTKETAKIAGTGLGLSICKKIIELHHGKVWVKSVEGEGSTFGFTLPVSAVSEGKIKEDAEK